MYVRGVLRPELEPLEVEGEGITLTGFATAIGASDRPLLLLLHGGGVNAHYFAATDDSVVDLAATNGFQAIALNRPGYADSTTPAGEPPSFAQQAEVVDAAMRRIWETRGGERPGAVRGPVNVERVLAQARSEVREIPLHLHLVARGLDLEIGAALIKPVGVQLGVGQRTEQDHAGLVDLAGESLPLHAAERAGKG